LKARRGRLDRLARVVHASTQELSEAVSRDFGHRSMMDSKFGEVWLTLKQIKYIRRHLRRWMKPRRQRTNWYFLPGRASVMPQPRGVVGILSPWNYPVMLALVPVAGALAAGNRVIVKLSEHTPETSALLAARLSEAFDDTLLHPLTGGPEVGREVSALKLDYLLYTGGRVVGQKVALAAAENLTPVTLELGGKCPAIYHRPYSVEKLAAAIAQGKCLTAGQSCVAPDYLLAQHGTVAEICEALKAEVAKRFPTMVDNPDYSGVAGQERLARLYRLVDDAVGRGASKVEINPANEAFDGAPKMPLILLLDVPKDAAVLSEELFGPVLPVIEYDTLDEAIAYVNQNPRPLAIYYFDTNRRRIQRVLKETASGGVTVNDTLIHFICDSLPRGGIGESGYGAYHGRRGFDTFTHYKSVFRQSRLKMTGLFAPPYTGLSERLFRFLVGRPR
jgi:acyl-CoA reductase-like NAD-dependent aldehyde dehydrogenase